MVWAIGIFGAAADEERTRKRSGIFDAERYGCGASAGARRFGRERKNEREFEVRPGTAETDADRGMAGGRSTERKPAAANRCRERGGERGASGHHCIWRTFGRAPERAACAGSP